MKMKKILVSLMAVLMMISSMQTIAFATEDSEPKEDVKPNFAADLGVVNADCKVLESMKSSQLSITITKNDDPSVTITSPVFYDEEWGSFYGERFFEEEAMGTILNDIYENQKAIEAISEEEIELPDTVETVAEESSMVKAFNVKLNELSEEPSESNIFDGYTVTLNGLPEEHYEAQFDGSVTNGETIKALFDMMKELFSEVLASEEYNVVGEDGKPVVFEAETYAELKDEILAATDKIKEEEVIAIYVLIDLFFGTTDEFIEDEEMVEDEEDLVAYGQKLIALMDETLMQARNGEYPASLYVLANLTCECPVMEYYEIYHEYYKEDLEGNRTLVARVAEGDEEGLGFSMLKGATGSYIRAEDYIQCEYEGRTYEYVNSYDSFTIYDEKPNWEKDIVTEFKLGDMMYSGMVLRYVEKEVPSAPEPVLDIEDDADVEPSEPEADSDEDAEVSPPTGDHTMIGIYIALIVTALAAVIVLLAYYKKKNKE